MAEDAFALSPISARASLPTEADYEAICGAFMETARGRWFLGEYAKRNRNADTRMVLDAVARIEETLAKQKAAADRSLAELLPDIAELVADARRRVVEALPKTDARPNTEPIQRAAGVLRDVAWTLRESGADTRVCDLLDVQAKAIVDGCARMHGDQAITPDASAAIGTVLDALILQIGLLARTEARAPAPQPAAPADAEPVVEAKHEAPPAPAEPQAFEAAPETTEPRQSEARQFHPTDPVSPPADHTAAAPVAETALTPIEADVRAGLWDDLEITDVDPDEHLVDADRSAAAEPAATAGAETAAIAATAAAVAEPPPSEAVFVIADEPAAPADIPADEYAVIAAEEPSQKTTPSSLGQAALDSGAVVAAATGRNLDVLAPIRRMSQAEKIAFFS